MHQILDYAGNSDVNHAPKFWQKVLAILVSVVLILGFWYQLMPKSYFEKDFIVGKVVENLGVETAENELFSETVQNVLVDLKNNETVEANLVLVGGIDESVLLLEGDKVVINFVENIASGSPYQVVDVYRLNVLLFLFLLLVLVGCIFSGWNAIFSFLGLAFSILVLIYVVVNGILAGYDPLLVTIVGAFLISTVSVYLGHGLTKRTTIAIIGIVLTLMFVGVLSLLFVKLGSLFGMGSEEAFFLQLDSERVINLQGIFLAGIIIGTLGVLDDITTSQVAVVDELYKANNKLSAVELYKRAISVGKEHITALINTLVLAYAGASMPLFILFIQDSIQPVWTLLIGEFIAEEIVRTLLGSIALILSVPVTTFLAAKFLHKTKLQK
jgi:uncharacterized membrane protein